jgi:hypothetical protein
MRAPLVGILCLGGVLAAAPARAQPANDQCAAATVIPSLPFTAALDIAGATADAGALDLSCYFQLPDATNPSVWYRFTAPAAVSLDIDTFGSDHDTVVAVHEGACGAFTDLRACNDDDPADDAFLPVSRTFVTLAQGETVHIEVRRVPDFFNPGTALVLHVQATPVFQVSRYTDDGAYPGVARNADGRFLVVWRDNPNLGPDAIVGQLYDARAVALGAPRSRSARAMGTAPTCRAAPATSWSSGGPRATASPAAASTGRGRRSGRSSW